MSSIRIAVARAWNNRQNWLILKVGMRKTSEAYKSVRTKKVPGRRYPALQRAIERGELVNAI
jgi:hypothetical protein